ncbi:MAG: hypothetical protein PHV93_01785 [Candidatus Pacebacteria bacterium]|nr:hypothetical protein [Candidatus Paceibacterota bacterium]
MSGRKQKKEKKKGFIALVSAIIISAVLLAILLSLNLGSFFTRFNILDSENKKRSALLALACFETARMNLSEDSLYAGNEKIMEGEDSCRICPLQASPGGIEIQTRALVHSAHTNLKALLNSGNLSILSFEETATSSAENCSLP